MAKTARKFTPCILQALNGLASPLVPLSDSLVIGGKDGKIYYYDTRTWRPQGQEFVSILHRPVSLSVCPNGSLIKECTPKRMGTPPWRPGFGPIVVCEFIDL